MKIYRIEFPNFPNTEREIVLITGNFDGIHLGHRLLIEEGKKISRIFKKKLVILTFEPHPYLFFHKNQKDFLLNTPEEKIKLIKSLKVDELWILDFNEKLAETSPEDFLRELFKTKISRLIIGPDHTFGKDKKGNIFTLYEFSKEKGIILSLFPFVKNNNRKISSTRIRELIRKGEIEEANKLLGYKFFINGEKIKGSGRGKKIGFPTINLKVSDLKVKPKEGVYIVECYKSNQKFQGLLYYGSRPTFNEKEKVFEVYLFDFKEELKIKNLKVEFYKFIRDDIKFENETELKKQIEKDVNIGYTFFLNKGSKPSKEL
ncbi:MAG: riboflavin biosynthesis protein RibF [Candidatus Hydrothermales bacterium]